MRGKAQRPYKPHGARGITPAYAGKRVIPHIIVGIIKDHPRLCGEKYHVLLLVDEDYGSPPPMRGKGHAAIFQIKTDGITPAYAGKRKISGCSCSV